MPQPSMAVMSLIVTLANDTGEGGWHFPLNVLHYPVMLHEGGEKDHDPNLLVSTDSRKIGFEVAPMSP